MLTILGGINKSGIKEPIKKVNIFGGQIISIIGPTGSGKTQLLNDINAHAQKNTPSKRTVILQGTDIAFVSQHNSFLADMKVAEFLLVHAKIKGKNGINKTIELANELTGEKILPQYNLTELSGGQSRSLMIADALTISDSPIVLLDEIENAGINKDRVLELLHKTGKILVFVSHDPRIILMSDIRMVMQNGGITHVHKTSKEEKVIYQEIIGLDNHLNDIRHKLRNGKTL